MWHPLRTITESLRVVNRSSWHYRLTRSIWGDAVDRTPTAWRYWGYRVPGAALVTVLKPFYWLFCTCIALLLVLILVAFGFVLDVCIPRLFGFRHREHPWWPIHTYQEKHLGYREKRPGSYTMIPPYRWLLPLVSAGLSIFILSDGQISTQSLAVAAIVMLGVSVVTSTVDDVAMDIHRTRKNRAKKPATVVHRTLSFQG